MEIGGMAGFMTGEPGLYRVTDEVYFAADYASQSRLNQLAKSERHLALMLAGDSQETDAMRFGSAAHAGFLEPDEYQKRWSVAGQCSAVTKSGSRCSKTGQERHDGKWYCGIHSQESEPDRVRRLTREEAARISAMWFEAMATDEVAAILGLPDAERELAALWRHRETGLLVKMKVDLWSPSVALLADYKTARDASPEGFAKAVANNGYHRQASLYLQGMNELGVPLKDFVFIPQEKEAPFLTAGYRLTDSAVAAGELELVDLFRHYATFRERARKEESPKWQGYSTGQVQTIDLPDWKYSQLEWSER